MIKDILVHFTGSEEDENRLAYAEVISDRFEAHLTGLYVHRLPEVVGADPIAMGVIEEWYRQSNAEALETFSRLQNRFERLNMPHDVLQVDVLTATAGEALTEKARIADLFIATRPYGDPSDSVHVEVSVLFDSGRGCLFVPPKGAAPTRFGTVLIAWNGSRESARAVAEAMPFLKQANQVILIVVRETDGSVEFGGDIARHLSRHGISAVLSTVDAGMDGVGQALLDEVRRVGGDLLVMGGYGHSRFREWVLGGATRHVLTNANIPVFIAR